MHKRKYSLVPVAVPPVETPYRRVITSLPVPESISVFEKLERFEPSSMQGQPPVLVDRAEDICVFDRWGNRWLDWSSGVLISNAGNSNPSVVKALRGMLDRPLLSTYVFAHEARAELVELLAGICPAPGYKTFLLSTGSEAIENTLKLARTYGLERHGSTKRKVVSFQNAFHGRTMGAQLAGGIPGQKKWLGSSHPDFIQVPFPDGYKNADVRFHLFLESLTQQGAGPEQICAVLTESFQGVGPDFFPVDYAKALERWCRDNDVLLIMDEVQAGFGRTGTWFAFENYGVIPDLIACGKGISGSLPLSAVIGRPDVMELYPPGSMTSTHSGSPLPVASAMANIRALQQGSFLSNAKTLDPVLRDGLHEIQKRHPGRAGCVQSRGLVAGIQMVKPGTRTPDPEAALAVNVRSFQKGLLMFAPVGIAGECIKIAPPLDIPQAALEDGLRALGEAMDETLG